MPYYVDLERTTPGIVGTKENPFTYEEFITAGDSNEPYLFRGKIDLDEANTLFINKPGFRIAGWDLENYGPWRIGHSSASIPLIILVDECKDGIINSEGSFYSSIEIISNGTKFFNTHIRTTADLLLDASAYDLEFNGCNLVTGLDSGTVEIDLDDTSTLTFRDSVIDFRYPFLTAVTIGSIKTSNCVFNYNGVDRFELATNTTHTNPQFSYNNPEPWPSWDAGYVDSTTSSPSAWAVWSTWGNTIFVGTGSYTTYPTGLFGVQRLGVGAFYFDTATEETFSIEKPLYITVLDRSIKTSTKFTSVGWVKNLNLIQDQVFIPLAVADLYGNVVGSDAAIKIEVERDSRDFRLRFSGAKSKLINRTLGIDLGDGDWHFLGYVCVDGEGTMAFYVDSVLIEAEEGMDETGLPFSIARSLSVRTGGGKVWVPHVYKAGTGGTLYNWRYGSGFALPQYWISDLMKIDKFNLGI